MPTTEVRVGVVGCGSIAASHARGFRATPAVRVACADIIPERARRYAQEWDFGRPHASLTDMLAAEELDLVAIATPPGSHAELAIEALSAGVDVLVEKPVCPTLAELDAIEEAAARSGRGAYAVVQHRHGSGARRAHALLSSGGLGAVTTAVCETLWYRPDDYFDLDWRGHWAGEGGGPTLGHGIHQIDLMLHLVGGWEDCTATARRMRRPVEFEDVSTASVTLADGGVATIVTSLLAPRELSRIRVDCDAGTLEVDHVYGYTDADWDFHPTPDAATAATLGKDPGLARDADDPDGGATDPWSATAGEEVPSNHTAQITRLVDDLAHGREHETTLASVRSTMELITAIYASALTGATVRRDDLAPGHPFYDRLTGPLSQREVDAVLTRGPR